MDEEGIYYKDQYKESTDYMKKQLRVMLDKKKTIETYSEPANFAPNYGNGGGGDDNTLNKIDAANMIGKFYYGTLNDIRSATSYIKGLDPSIVDIKRGNDRIIIERNDGKGNTTYKNVWFTGGNNGQRTFIQTASSELLGIPDIVTSLKQGSYIEGKPLSKYDQVITNRTVTGDENMNKQNTLNKRISDY
jgi:hypothetical protein